MNPLIGIGAGLIVFIVFAMIASLMMGGGKAREKRALAVIRGQGSGSENSSSDARDSQDRRRAEIARKLKEMEGKEGGAGKKKKDSLSARLEQGGIAASPKKFWMFSILTGVVVAVAAQLLGASSFVVLMALITGIFGLPQMFLRHKIKKRQKKFLEEFADALEAMVRLLKAGMPVTEAISMAGREFTGPVGEEMTRIYEAQKVGIPLPEAALSSARRMPITEMQMFATGLSIQAQTGASLSEVLMNLAKVIRARFRLKRKVQALSSEAKASAMIIGSLPFLVGGGMYGINPDYIGLLFETNIGRILLVGSAVWMGIGIMIMKAMINFRV